MLKYLNHWIHIHIAEEHRMTRWHLTLTSLIAGWTIAAVMHSLHVVGF